jgi:hypothetical protein
MRGRFVRSRQKKAIHRMHSRQLRRSLEAAKFLVRPTVILQSLTGVPFHTRDPRDLGMSWKTLQGSRFRRIADLLRREHSGVTPRTNPWRAAGVAA